MAVSEASSGRATAVRAVRNSVFPGVFLAVAAHPKMPLAVVELAGRGVTAAAAGTRWVLEVGKPSLDGSALAGRLMDLGELEDRLVDLWQAFGSGEVGPRPSGSRLAEIVAAMEEWAS